MSVNLQRPKNHPSNIERSPEVRCAVCGKRPHEIPGFAEMVTGIEGRPLSSPAELDEWVRSNDGTYNILTNRLACDECYIEIGLPSLPGPGWKAP